MIEYILAFIYFCITPSLWVRMYRILLINHRAKVKPLSYSCNPLNNGVKSLNMQPIISYEHREIHSAYNSELLASLTPSTSPDITALAQQQSGLRQQLCEESHFLKTLKGMSQVAAQRQMSYRGDPRQEQLLGVMGQAMGLFGGIGGFR